MPKFAVRALAVALGVLAGSPAALAASPAALAQTPRHATGTYANVSVPRATLTQAEDITDSGLIVGCFQRKSGPERGFTDRHGKFAFLSHPSAPAIRP